MPYILCQRGTRRPQRRKGTPISSVDDASRIDIINKESKSLYRFEVYLFFAVSSIIFTTSSEAFSIEGMGRNS